MIASQCDTICLLRTLNSAQVTHLIFFDNLPNAIGFGVGWHTLIDDLGHSIEHRAICEVSMLQTKQVRFKVLT